MPTTFKKIASVTLASTSSSISFTSIPNTYTDLSLRLSVRSNRPSDGFDYLFLRFNNNTSSTYSVKYGTGYITSTEAPFQLDSSRIYMPSVPATNTTGAVFSNFRIYIPNYAGNIRKTMNFSLSHVNNSSTLYTNTFGVGMWQNTSAITDITFTLEYGSFIADSTVSLFGISKT